MKDIVLVRNIFTDEMIRATIVIELDKSDSVVDYGDFRELVSNDRILKKEDAEEYFNLQSESISLKKNIEKLQKELSIIDEELREYGNRAKGE